MGELRVALLGFGPVAQELALHVAARRPDLRLVSVTDRSGTVVDERGLDAPHIVHAKRAERKLDASRGERRDWTTREAAALAPADVVVQLTPTDLRDASGALAEIHAAARSRKHVVTAAKGALALEPGRVRAEIERHGVRLLYSASVCGSVPVVELLEHAFRGDHLHHLAGVLNGSTTYLLSQLEDGVPYERALGHARAAGILERDPSLDLLGLDAAAKAAILHQAAYGSQLTLGGVETAGVAGVTADACVDARSRGMAIRLVARVDPDGARVRPLEVPRDSVLAAAGTSCGLRLTFQGAGTISLTGPGAGPRETASAVLSDVLRIATARDARARRAQAPRSALPARS